MLISYQTPMDRRDHLPPAVDLIIIFLQNCLSVYPPGLMLYLQFVKLCPEQITFTLEQNEMSVE